MLNFLCKFFLQEPNAGEKNWYLRDSIDKSPWPKDNVKPVEILDYKYPWVRYRIGKLFPDERLELSHFVFSYKKVDRQ